MTKAPRFATRIQRAVSGREVGLLKPPMPIWSWTLTYTLLRDRWDVRGGAGPGSGPGAGYDELRTLMGFFLQQQGAFQSFLFNDPTDDHVNGQLIGTGDGGTAVSSWCARWNGFSEPIVAPNAVSAVYFNGIVKARPITQSTPRRGLSPSPRRRPRPRPSPPISPIVSASISPTTARIQELPLPAMVAENRSNSNPRSPKNLHRDTENRKTIRHPGVGRDPLIRGTTGWLNSGYRPSPV